MTKSLKSTTSEPYLLNVGCNRACGHWAIEKRWVYSYEDALVLVKTVLEKYPCSACMKAMTKINNQVIEGKQHD